MYHSVTIWYFDILHLYDMKNSLNYKTLSSNLVSIVFFNREQISLLRNIYDTDPFYVTQLLSIFRGLHLLRWICRDFVLHPSTLTLNAWSIFHQWTQKNHPILCNSNPSVTANKVIHCLKWRERGGGAKTNDNIILFKQRMKRCIQLPFFLFTARAQCGETYNMGESPVLTVSPGNYSGYDRFCIALKDIFINIDK